MGRASLPYGGQAYTKGGTENLHYLAGSLPPKASASCLPLSYYYYYYYYHHHRKSKQGKAVPVHAMNAYGGSKGISPHILNFVARWR